MPSMQQKKGFLYIEFYQNYSRILGNGVWPKYLFFKNKKETKKWMKEGKKKGSERAS